MNFVGKFDAGLPFAGVHPNAKLHADSVSGQAPSGSVVIKDAQLLFTGDYKKAGLDLVISRDGQEVVVPEYFKGDKRAALASPDGAHLTGDIVSALAGHAQYAQTADGSASAAKVIGHVTKLTGNATVIRNGVSIVLNMGDTVNQGDVVQSGSGSTLGITFIDGSVFGLGSNARMVLNEMVYDPNGSNNSSLLSLVQGTISFVAGATAKHGDMKVDTPVATMGIRGTAVLVEIDFEIPGSGLAPPARFQVLVEPDGTTGSYVLLDKATLTPIATVNQAGTQTTVNGQGVVSFLSSAQLSPEAQEVINKVFALKFTETNPNSTTRFSDIGVPQNTFVQLANGDIVNVRLIPLNLGDNPTPSGPPPGGTQKDRVPGPPTVATFNAELAEKTGLKGSSLIDSVSGGVTYAAINVGDVPTLKTAFNSYTYASAQGLNVTTGLTAEQKAAIDAVTVPLTVVQDPAGKNTGTATWTYDIADHALDFLAEGEELTLTYVAEVANNYPQNNEKTFKTFTITITGTNDVPVIETTHSGFLELPGTANSAIDHAGGTITFEDVDLTDRPTVTTSFDSYTYEDRAGNDVTLLLTNEQKADIDAVKAALSLTPAPGNGHNGSVNWSYDVADHKFDFLAAGEVLTLTYMATVNDHHGGIATVPVTVTVTGTNDVPTIATTASAITERPGTTGSTALDVAQGTVTFTDVDLTDRPVVTTSFGSFQYLDEDGNDVTPDLTPAQLAAIDQVDIDLVVVQAGTGNNGTANWTYSIADSKFDFLADGETLILTYVATVNDGHGGVVSTPITITVTGSADVSVGGTNDLPVVTTTDNAFVEAPNTTGSTANDQVTGSITFTDPDLTDTHSVTIKGVASSGVTSGLAADGTVLNWLSLGTLVDSSNGATGSRPWTFKAPDNNFDYLAKGEVLTLTYTIEVDDHHGGVVTKPVVVTVTGTNDTPTIEVGATTATGGVVEDGTQTASGTITFQDVDLSDTHVLSQALTGGSASSTLPGFNPATQQMGTLTLTHTPNNIDTNNIGTVGWSFALDNALAQQLADGQVITQTYTVTINDQHGGTVTQDVTVTITGANDEPSIEVAATTATGAVVEDGTQTAAGTITFKDVDLTDTHTLSQTLSGGSASTDLPGFNPATQQMGTLTLTHTPNNTDTNNLGTVGWSFALNNALAQQLADGQVITQTYTVTINDQHGGTVTQDVTVTITGANDKPSIEVAATTAAGAVVEDGTQTASGTITFKDVDLTDTHLISQALTDGSASSTLPGFNPATQQMGTLTLTHTPNNTDTNNIGAVGWSFALDNALAQQLADGQVITQTYTVTINDQHGGTVTQDVTVTITGANDEPSIEVAATTATGAVVEDGTQTASGTITFKDVDLTDTQILSQALTDGSASTDLPGFNPATQQMGTLTLTHTPNNTDTNNIGTVGWSFALNNALAQQLADGQVITQTYTVTINDQHGGTVTQDVTVTITGANDEPSIEVAATTATGAVVEDGTQTASGTITFKDVDLTDSHLISQALTDGSASTPLPGFDPETQPLGTLTLTHTPNNTDTSNLGTVGWTFTLDNALAQQLADGQVITQTYTVTINDQHGGTVTQDVTVTITGTNDAPTVSTTSDAIAELPDATGSAIPDTASGTISFADVDLIDTPDATAAFTSFTYTDAALTPLTPTVDQQAAIAAVEATLSLTPAPTNANNGSTEWVYSVDDSALDFLADGEILTLTYTATVDDGHTTVTKPFTVTITGSNDAPTLDAGTLAATTEDSNGTPQQISGIFADDFHDVDNGASLAGIAVTDADTGGTGAWWYSDDGGVWQQIGNVSADSALVLHAGAHLKFVPAPDYNGTPPALTVHAIDNTYTGAFTSSSGTTATVDLSLPSSHGGGTPFAQDPTSIMTSVTAVNDAPVIALGANYATFNGAGAASTAASTVATTQTDNVTMEGWVKWDGSGGAGQMLFYNGSTSTAGFGLFGAPDGQGHLVLEVLSGGVVGVQTSTSIAANEWHHVALTRSNGIFNLYVDGQLQESWSQGVNPINLGDDGAHVNNVDRTMIGGLPGVNSHSFNGSIGEVRIWNEAHDATQINLYKNVSLTGGEANLAGYWRLNDATGATADDATAGNHNLSLSGGPGFAIDSASGWPQTAGATAEDTSVAIGGLSISDVDAGADQVQVILSVEHGVLALGSTAGLSVSGLNSAAVTLTGAQSAINAALASGLNYTPAADYNGGDTLSITVNDQGHNGSGSALSTTRSVALTVNAVNDAPVITSGDGDTAQVSIAENMTAVTTVTATDIDSANLTYSVVTDDSQNSPDGAKFTIDPVTGALSFVAAPDYEANGSAAGSNDYTVQVRVSDGAGGVDIQTVTVTVTDIAEAPTIAFNGAPEDVTGEFAVSYAGSTANTVPALASLGDGRFVATYMSLQSSSFDIYAEILDSDGNAVSGPFLVNSNNTSEWQGYQDVVALADGTFVVTWDDDPSAGGINVFGARFDQEGTTLDGPFNIGTHWNVDDFPKLAALPNGGFAVAWHIAATEGTNRDIHAQFFDAHGTPTTAELDVSAVAGDEKYPDIIALPDGRAVVTWLSGVSGPQLLGRIVEPDGDLGPVFQVNNGALDFNPPSVSHGREEHQFRQFSASLEDGGFVVAWTSEHDGSFDIYGQIFNADGSARGGQLSLAADPYLADLRPTVTGLSDGGFVVTWHRGPLVRSASEETDTPADDVYAQRFDADGHPIGDEFLVNTTQVGRQYYPEVTETTDGRMVIVWASSQDGAGGTSAGVYGKTFDLPGHTLEDSDIDLPVTITLANPAAEVVQRIVITGLPAQFTLDAGVLELDGSWVVDRAQGAASVDLLDDLAAGNGLTLHPAANFNGTYTLSMVVTAHNTTSGQEAASSALAVPMSIRPVNDAPVITSGDGATAQVSIMENTTAVTTVTATDIDSANLAYSIVTDDYQNSPDGTKFTINPTTGVLGFVAAPDYELNGSADETNDYTVQVRVSDGAGGVDIQTLTVTVTDDPEIPVVQAPALVSQTFLGGMNNQAATDVTYHNGHLYLTWNTLPVTQTVMDNGKVVSFSTTANGTPTQDFAQTWSYGHFNGVASDGTHIYAVGASHPDEGLTSDGSGGAEVKTMMGRFDVNGVAGSNPAPATDYAATNFFGYGGVEIFQDVVVTTQAGNTVFYAVGHGQPASYGAYVIASYNASSNLLNVATDPLPVPGFSVARDVVEFNGQIWAVGYTEHSGDPVGRAAVWAASYDLSSVATYKDTVETAAGNFEGAAVIDSNLYAVGNVTSNGNDYLVAKYNADGSVAWSHSFGGSGSDFLTGAVALNGHLYVVGHSTNGGDTDGVLMEISTVDGSVLSTTTYDGALNDFFNSITTDGQYLYVAGESKSYSVGGNSAPDSDAILLTYDVGGGPVIDTEHFTTESAGDNEPTTIAGLSVSNFNASEALTLTATTAEAGAGSTVTPPSGSGNLVAVNDAIDSVVYDPGSNAPLTDMITFTVSGASGSDTVNFIFNQAGTGPVALQGTSGKDVLFGTESSDTLAGGAAKDQFVFTPTESGAVQHVITDFETPLDKIDLRAFTSIDSIGDLIGVVQQGSDTLVTIDTNDSLLLQNVLASNVRASNFIFHSLLVA